MTDTRRLAPLGPADRRQPRAGGRSRRRRPRATQQRVGVDIGTDYPYPVVDYEARASQARETYASLDGRAKEALSDPAIRRRGSFSNRRSRTDENEDDGQATLSEFGG